jgi:WD40 repeat protein
MVIFRYEPHKGAEVTALTYHPKTHQVATGSSDKTITLRAAKGNRTGALWPKVQFRRIKGHEGAITAVAFTADGKRLVSGSQDKTIRIWDVGTLKEIGKIPLTEAVNALALDPRGTRAVVATVSGIRIVDLTKK